MASIRRRKRARGDVWIVDYHDVTGRRHRLTAPTKVAAEHLLAERIRDRQHVELLSPDREITLAEYKDRWLENVAGEITPRTLEGYKQQLRLHVLPAFGRMRVREITRGMIKTLLAQKHTSGLSKNSVRMIRTTLSVILSEAVDDGIIPANPALGLGRRGRSRAGKLTVADQMRNIRPMSQEQLGIFLAAAKEHTPAYVTLFVLLAHAGQRPGEAFALRWTGLDFVKRQIRVERALSARRIEPTKTGRARTVDMSEVLARALRRLHLERRREVLERGWEAMPPWVFCTEAGTPLDESRVRKNLPGRSRGPDSEASASTTSATPLRRYSWPPGHPSPTWRPSSATPSPQPHSNSMRTGSRQSISASSMCWLGRRRRGRGQPERGGHGRRELRLARAGTNWAPKAIRALLVIQKRPKRLVGRQGLEPWTR